jgi:hypothetical protein
MQLFYNPKFGNYNNAFDKEETNILLKYFVKKIPIFYVTNGLGFYSKLKLH